MRSMLWIGLMVVGLCACATEPPASNYRVTLPTLEMEPREFSCELSDGSKADCVILLSSDLRKIVRKLKAACLALGGTEVECQAERPTLSPAPQPTPSYRHLPDQHRQPPERGLIASPANAGRAPYPFPSLD